MGTHRLEAGEEAAIALLQVPTLPGRAQSRAAGCLFAGCPASATRSEDHPAGIKKVE